MRGPCYRALSTGLRAIPCSVEEAAALFRELFGVVGTDALAALGHLTWLLVLGLALFPVAPNVFRHRLVN